MTSIRIWTDRTEEIFKRLENMSFVHDINIKPSILLEPPKPFIWRGTPYILKYMVSSLLHNFKRKGETFRVIKQSSTEERRYHSNKPILQTTYEDKRSACLQKHK